MHILHVGKYYWPYKGGMETVLQNLCEAHAQRARITALVSSVNGTTREETIAGVHVIRAGCMGTPLSVPLPVGLVGWIRKAQADVIVHHEPNPLALLAYLRAQPNSAFVVWFHSDIIRQRLFYWTYRPFLQSALQKAQAIVVASPNHVRYTPVLGEFSHKCCVIPFGIYLSRFQLNDTRQARAAEIRRGSSLPILLFVGRFAYYKGLEYLVDSMRAIKARLILIGSGPMEKAIRERAREVETPGSIELTGELPDEELVAYLHACDVLVLPSVERSEAFGVVQIEAMACGKPVVSCRIPSGVPWVNRDGETGLTVPPRDGRALAAAINTLLKDPACRERLGRNGQLRVENEFTVERMAEMFWEVLQRAREGRIPDACRYDPRDTMTVDESPGAPAS